MQALKIAVIGGGSSYTPELIEGIIVRYEQLPVTELALVDVESGREKVEIIAALTRRMLTRKGLEHVIVSVHFALDEAIRGASFVLTQLRVGQLAGAGRRRAPRAEVQPAGPGNHRRGRIRQSAAHHPGDP
ncbi:6-phospho-beta-glucosidase [Raoultella terrigena]|uniref:6-phospho-beta-glucosidase n=1 Tax=Raoultella terrigena TaxID=577 RepID=A0A4U9D4Q7_RAOTE|nr:6-phospho-beta-glucosidase [Raoultella terrigena]